MGEYSHCRWSPHTVITFFFFFIDRVYHRDKKEMILDKAKRRKLEVVLTTHETARVHVVSVLCVTFYLLLNFLSLSLSLFLS